MLLQMQKNFHIIKGGADLGTPRNHEDQKTDALNAKTKTEQNKIELENGCRTNVLTIL